MNITEIAEKINHLSNDYKIGDLQGIRKKLKNSSRKAGSAIFANKTISEEGWAFHYGGRKELQFNIGYEDEGLRYGIAFSLETSRTLPSIDIFFPKILKINSLIVSQPELFYNYKMWYWQGNKRSEIFNVFEINEALILHGTFIFIGKLMNYDEINYDEILKTFDQLLNIYIDIENENPIAENQDNVSNQGFIFVHGTKNLPQNTNYTKIQQQINVNARHSLLQQKLYENLVSFFGEENVGMENYINGKKIDIVLQVLGQRTFYEIKTSNSAKQCIREALGQIFEYTYYGGEKYASKIIVAGEYPIDAKTEKYLAFLNTEFNLPISYHQIHL